MEQRLKAVQLPKSITSNGAMLAGLVSILCSLFFIKNSAFMIEAPIFALASCVAIPALVMMLYEVFIDHSHKHPDTGLQFTKSNYSIKRTIIKFYGLMISFFLVYLMYRTFPEYSGSFYDDFYKMLKTFLPAWFVLSFIYIFFVDAHQKDPKEDSYYLVGKVFLGQFQFFDGAIFKNHFLGWLIKAYFLPLMFTWGIRDIIQFQKANLLELNSFERFYDIAHLVLYKVDLIFAVIGYIFSLKLINSHIRTAEPTFFGWAIALMCYEPFWSLIGKMYLSYESPKNFMGWMQGEPVFMMIWGSIILFTVLIYVLSTMFFGTRFSNLTNRGIITAGPYRFTKHPAYVSKNLSWWMISLPFLSTEGPLEAFRHCILLLLLNSIYFFRARTEERHLSKDPTYVQYALWINENGIFSGLSRLRIFRFLKYKEPINQP